MDEARGGLFARHVQVYIGCTSNALALLLLQKLARERPTPAATATREAIVPRDRPAITAALIGGLSYAVLSV